MQRQSQSQKYGWNSNTLKFEHLDYFWTFTDTKMQLFICRFFIVLNFLSIHLKFHALKDTKSPNKALCVFYSFVIQKSRLLKNETNIDLFSHFSKNGEIEIYQELGFFFVWFGIILSSFQYELFWTVIKQIEFNKLKINFFHISLKTM